VVRRFRDALGVPVDEAIEDVVVALRLLGFNTISSCAGHLDRPATGPYVMCKSDRAFEVLEKSREQMGRSSEEDGNLLKGSQTLALEDGNRLRLLLESYDAYRKIDPNLVLEVRPAGYWAYRLCFVHAEFSHLLGPLEFGAVMDARQREMKRFAKFLKSEVSAMGVGDVPRSA
jgi:hypothetical protein